IVVRALAEPALAEDCIVFGDAGVLQATATWLQLPVPPRIEPVTRLQPLPRLGEPDAAAGDAAYRYIVAAARSARSGEARALVTAPISKAALQAAGHRWPGHTELLADLAGGAEVRMMLANDELRVVLVTVHLALRDAIDALDTKRILETIAIADAGLRRAGIAKPRLAVAGLNPHARDSRLVGREASDIIAPAVEAARADGIDATGPHPPDTVFMQARGFARFDAVIAMYHDQGLIPVKYRGIDQGVNVTLGLPFVRTSPNHGTAYAIAGQDLAGPPRLLPPIPPRHPPPPRAEPPGRLTGPGPGAGGDTRASTPRRCYRHPDALGHPRHRVRQLRHRHRRHGGGRHAAPAGHRPRGDHPGRRAADHGDG